MAGNKSREVIDVIHNGLFDVFGKVKDHQLGEVLKVGKPQTKSFAVDAELIDKVSRTETDRLQSSGQLVNLPLQRFETLILCQRLERVYHGKEQMQEGREAIPWSVMACILTVARFCAPSSELQIADSWYDKTALDDLLGVPTDRVNDDRLYRSLDALLPHKDALCKHLQGRYGELFGETFEFLFYDIISTYFEGTAVGNPQAKRGYSRDSRPDCPQVCIGLVTSREGLPLAFEVFDGNRADVTTTEELVMIMESKYGKANRIWVMDRGMVSEENIEFMQAQAPDILSARRSRC